MLDYNSLYPSSMINFNISHEMLVLDEKYLGLTDYEYNTVEYTEIVD